MSKPGIDPSQRAPSVDVPLSEPANVRVHAAFRKAVERYGVVDRLLRAFAFAPGHASTAFDYLTAATDSDRSDLTPRERAILGVVVSAANRSAFGLATHGARLRVVSAQPDLVEMLVENPRLATLTKRERVLVDMAIKMTRAASALEKRDLAELKSLGVPAGVIFEVVELVAALNAIDRIANALGVTPSRRSAREDTEHDFPMG